MFEDMITNHRIERFLAELGQWVLGVEQNRIEFSVAGAGNVTRSLDRNAELQLTLKNKDVNAGEDIEVSIRAPYAGAVHP